MPLRVLTAAMLFALAALPAAAQGRAGRSARTVTADEAAILLIEYEIFEAIRGKDAAALGRHLAEDFVYRTPTENDLPRKEFLRSLAALPYKILDVRGGSLKVSVYGDVAVLTGVQFARIEAKDGKEETGATAFTDVFVRRGGRWLMTLAHGVEVPPPPKGGGKP